MTRSILKHLSELASFDLFMAALIFAVTVAIAAAGA